MAIKTTGGELNAFFSDPKFWPEGVELEEDIIEVDGVLLDEEASLDSFSLNAQVKVRGGVVVRANESKTISLTDYFRKWRRLQNVVYILCKASKEKETEVLAAITAAGGRIVK